VHFIFGELVDQRFISISASFTFSPSVNWCTTGAASLLASRLAACRDSFTQFLPLSSGSSAAKWRDCTSALLLPPMQGERLCVFIPLKLDGINASLTLPTPCARRKN
jgi:hypothetical protein